MADFYELQLIVLAVFCVFGLLLERFVSHQKAKYGNGEVELNGAHIPLKDEDELEEEEARAASGSRSADVDGEGDGVGWRVNGGSREAGGAASLARVYLIVFAVVMGADWLQGPYLYSLYREQFNNSERMVAILFVTGFTAAGLTAPLVGVWADHYGRKKLCMYFCALYATACILAQFNFIPTLLLGRVLGGISTSILFSVFESWLISSAHSRALTQGELSSIMGHATLINGFVAATAGVAANGLVGITHSFASPFMASGVFLVIGWVLIKTMWTENYGGNTGEGGWGRDLFQIGRMRTAWHIVRGDASLLVLGLAQTCFEGSMYLFVFLWVPALQEVAGPNARLPLGFIFASFMVSMMIGSLIYTSVASHSNPNTVEPSLILHAKLSTIVCAVSGVALAASVSSGRPETRFWAFCVFEMCVGMYYPVQGMLRGALIPNDSRATLSALFRVPLNIFVIIALLTGVSSARHYVFTGCVTMLAISAVTTGLVIVRRAAALASGTAGGPVSLRTNGD